MTESGKKKEYSILDFINETISKFPTDTEREELIRSLDILIRYFQNLQEKFKLLPNDIQQKEVLSAVDTIKSFLVSAREKPLIAAAFGLPYRKTAFRREAKEEVSPLIAEKIFNELKTLSTERIQQRLLDYRSMTMDELHALASYVGIKHPQRIKRQDLVDKIVKIGFANIRAYETLRESRD